MQSFVSNLEDSPKCAKMVLMERVAANSSNIAFLMTYFHDNHPHTVQLSFLVCLNSVIMNNIIMYVVVYTEIILLNTIVLCNCNGT